MTPKKRRPRPSKSKAKKKPGEVVRLALLPRPAKTYIPWDSPKVQESLFERLGDLATAWDMAFDITQGQSKEAGQNDPALLRDVARVLRAVTHAGRSGGDGLVADLGETARAYLRKQNLDLELSRPDVLRELHGLVVARLAADLPADEAGFTGSDPYTIARDVCLRIDGRPSPLRDAARKSGHELSDEREAGELAEVFRKVRRRADAPSNWRKLAIRLLVAAGRRWGIPEAQAFKLFSFLEKEAERLEREAEKAPP